MSIDVMVLRAMLRLSRRREPADEEALVVRTGGTPADVRAAVRRLSALGLVVRRKDGAPRLTMEGLATSVALLPARTQQRVSRPARRRSRAA